MTGNQVSSQLFFVHVLFWFAISGEFPDSSCSHFKNTTYSVLNQVWCPTDYHYSPKPIDLSRSTFSWSEVSAMWTMLFGWKWIQLTLAQKNVYENFQALIHTLCRLLEALVKVPKQEPGDKESANSVLRYRNQLARRRSHFWASVRPACGERPMTCRGTNIHFVLYIPHSIMN